MFKNLIFLPALFFLTAAKTPEPTHQSKTVYVFGFVRSADLKKTVYSDVFAITVEEGSAYVISSETNSALKKLESSFKKYMYINESWDRYVSTGGFYDDSRSRLEEKRQQHMVSEKRSGYAVSGSLFSFSYRAGDAYRNN